MPPPDPVHRILDASLNRCAEGLRCIEEYTRMCLGDGGLTATAKQLRHDLFTSAERLDRSHLLSARDTPGDVGTVLATESEASRPRVTDVVGAAIGRSGQALRALEEYGKVVDPEFAAEIEHLRYTFYRFAADVELTFEVPDPLGVRRRRRLAAAQLYALVPAFGSEDEFAKRLTRLFGAGVDLVQIRDPGADDRTIYRRSLIGSEISRSNDGLFIVNDRPDIAVAADADGAHVGQEELPAVAARKALGRERLLGISTHDMDQVSNAIRDGADMIGCGPTFPSTTKSFTRFPGTRFLSAVAESRPDIPAFAIGGITVDNIEEVANTRIGRIAVTSALADPNCIQESVKKLRLALEETVQPLQSTKW